MIYGRFSNLFSSILLPIGILLVTKPIDSFQIDDSLFNVASSHSSKAVFAGVVSHAFVQMGSELHYFRDVSHQEVLLSSISDFNDKQIRKFDTKKAPKNVAIFEKEVTNFGSSFVGVPVSRKIFVINQTNSKLIFTAITSSNIDFHCSFFKNKILEPDQKTNFTVLFLPSKEGLSEDIIYLHTSIGKFTHKLSGDASSNPYRISSYSEIILPLNGTFIAPISIHNPYMAIMKVVEIFSSDSNVQLELFNNSFARSGSSKLWEIAPFETKNIANVNILGNVERNMTSFIFIKYLFKFKYMKKFIFAENSKRNLNNIDDDDKLPDRDDEDKILDKDDEDEKLHSIIIAVRTQVLQKQGIYSTTNIFDFGMIKYGDQSKTFNFRVYSNIEKGVDIESIYVANENRFHGIYMHFSSKPPFSIKCATRNHLDSAVSIANINLNTKFTDIKEDSIIINEKLFKKRGLIVAESRGGNYNITVPYEALIYKGELLHQPEEVAFYYKLNVPLSRSIQLTNDFSFPLAIWNVTIAENGKDIFEVQLVNSIIVLLPQQTLPVLVVKYLQFKSDNFSTYFTIYTNLTSFNIPLFIFNGKLEISLNSIDQNQFDFGHISFGERRSILITITNQNPTQILINKFQYPLKHLTSIELQKMSSIQQNMNNKLLNKWQFMKNFWNLEMDFIVPSNTFIIFNYSFVAPTSNYFFKSLNESSRIYKKLNNENFILRTNFDEFIFPVTFTFTSKLFVSVPQSIIFKNSFVGTVHSQPIKIYSNYDEDLPFHRISISNNDSRFFLKKSENFNGKLKSNEITTPATLFFVPEASCLENANSNECYVGIPLNTPDGQWFTYGLKLPQNLAEIDSYLYGRLRRKWAALVADKINTTIVLDTSKVKNYEIPVQANLIWPKLLSHSVVHFPLTAVGNFTIVNLTLRNPSNKPVVVQLLPLVIYPDAEAMLDFFRDEFPAPLIEPVEMNETLMFSLRDTELFTLRPGSPVPKLREELEKVVNTQVPRFTLSMLLQPGMKTRIRIGFLPSDYILRSSLLLIRNNLTGIEPIVLYGQGAQIRMEIDNKTVRSKEALLFEILPSHLSDCRNPKRLLNKLPTTLTVKRSFTVKNTAKVTFLVMNISISNMPCENRGFRILNCEPFRLEPNETFILDIAYTPDFLMSINDASLQLYMHMNGTPWVFDLSASIPRQMLSMCHAALPRPAFEYVMYYTCILALIFCLICVIACSYLEADRIISCSIRQLFINNSGSKVFDLNSALSLSTSDNDRFSSLNEKTSLYKKILSIFKLRNCLSVRYRNYFYITPEANCFIRMALRFINNTLWLFSHFWMFVRGIDETATNSSCVELNKGTSNNFKSVEKSSEVLSSKNSSLKYTNLNSTTSSESNPSTKTTLSQTNSNSEHSSHETLTTLSKMISVSTKNDISSANKLINNLLSQSSGNNDSSKLINLISEKENTTPLLLNDILHENHNLNNQLTENFDTVLKKSKMTHSCEDSAKDFKIRVQKNLKTEKHEELKSSDFYNDHNKNENQDIKLSKETKIEKKKSTINKKQAVKSSSYSPTKDLENKNHSKKNKIAEPILFKNMLSEVENSTAFPLFSGPPPGFESSVNVKSSESSESLSSSSFSFAKSDTNKAEKLNEAVFSMPEWIDAPVKLGDINEEFNTIALNAAAAFENFENNSDNVNHETLFNDQSYSANNSPSLNKSDLSKPVKPFQRTPRRPAAKKNEKDDTTAESSACPSDTNIGKTIKRRKKVKSYEAARLIAELTRNYRKQLTEFFDNDEVPAHILLEEFKKLQSNFPTTSKDSKNDTNNSWYLNGFSSSPYENSLSRNTLPSQKDLPLSSGYSFPQNLISESTLFNPPNAVKESFPDLGFIGDGGKRLNTDMLETSMNNFFSSNFFGPSDNSVFSLNDPIWKPIFKGDDAENILKFSSIWPTDFNHNSGNNNNKETNKKPKND